MGQLFDQCSHYFVKDSFEICAEYKSGHAIGLVVVLDRKATEEAHSLTGRPVQVSRPNGSILHLMVDEAKDHLAATSLFFRGISIKDVPILSQIRISCR